MLVLKFSALLILSCLDFIIYGLLCYATLSDEISYCFCIQVFGPRWKWEENISNSKFKIMILVKDIAKYESTIKSFWLESNFLCLGVLALN